MKFLLATTDPQKLPVTILSRCLQFNLKRLPQPAIRKQLETLLEKESIGADSDSIQMIARAADGSMRDALSLLDQAIAFCGGALKQSDVASMLGTIDRGYIFELLAALGQRDARALFQNVQNLAQQSPDFGDLLAELNSTLQRIALAQQLPDAIDDSYGDQERIHQLAKQLDPNDVQLFYQIGILGRRDLPLASNPQSGFEMVLLRMLAFAPAGSTASPSATPAGRADSSAQEAPAFKGAPSARVEKTAPPPTAATPAPATAWEQLISELTLTGLAKELAANCVLASRDEQNIRLLLRRPNAHILSDASRDRLQTALQARLGTTARLLIEVVDDATQESPAQLDQKRQQARQEAAQRTVLDDVGVKALIDTFDARIDNDSVRPLE